MRGLRWTITIPILALVWGCGPQREPVENGAGPTKTAGSAQPVKVGQVTDAGGIDDRSFNASAWAGLQRAKNELGIEPKYLESREQSDYKTNLSSLADQKDGLVFAVGYLMEDALKEVAPSYPDTKFAIIDGSAPNSLNCASIKFREEEGCFLAGFLAGKMTKTGAIGFVGGMEGALIKKFECGYIAGARTAKPDIRVAIKYVGSWKDLTKGKEMALVEYNKDGADIIFHAAGKSGLGVLDAANEKGPGFYGIGVDADQDDVHPGRVLCSMMKGVDEAVFDTVKQFKEGKWQPGEHVFGIKEGGVHLSPMKNTKKDVPPDVLAKIEVISKAIADGKIKVPSTADELQNFQPPRV